MGVKARRLRHFLGLRQARELSIDGHSGNVTKIQNVRKNSVDDLRIRPRRE
jgi:hypothetical protein